MLVNKSILLQPSDSAPIDAPIPATHTSSSPLRVKKLPPTYARQSSDQPEGSPGLSSQRTPKCEFFFICI